MTPIPNSRRAKVTLMPMFKSSRVAALFWPAVVDAEVAPLVLAAVAADGEVVPAELVAVGEEVAAGPAACA